MIVRYEWFTEDVKPGLKVHDENTDYLVIQTVHGLKLVCVTSASLMFADTTEEIVYHLNNLKCAPGWVIS